MVSFFCFSDNGGHALAASAPYLASTWWHQLYHLLFLIKHKKNQWKRKSPRLALISCWLPRFNLLQKIRGNEVSHAQNPGFHFVDLNLYDFFLGFWVWLLLSYLRIFHNLTVHDALPSSSHLLGLSISYFPFESNSKWSYSRLVQLKKSWRLDDASLQRSYKLFIGDGAS